MDTNIINLLTMFQPVDTVIIQIKEMVYVMAALTVGTPGTAG